MSETPPILALGLDNRTDLCREIVGSGDEPTASERERAASLKQVAFDGLARAIELGVPKSSVLVWSEPDLGEGVLLRARALGLTIAVALERRGAGPAALSAEAVAAGWGAATRLAAQYASARVAYNFWDEPGAKHALQAQLKEVAGKCQEAGKKLIVELTPYPRPEQADSPAGGTTPLLKAQLIVEAIRELQDAGVEPAAWAFVPPEDRLAAATAAAQAHVDGRSGVTVLFEVAADPDPGRASPGPSRSDRAMTRLAARTLGVGGLVAGPDAYFSALARLHRELAAREQTVAAIAAHLRKLWELFSEARSASHVS